MPRYLVWPKKAWLRLRSGPLLRRLGLGIPRRHLAATAPVVAVVGADGSGKSRLTGDLTAWLGRKLVVHHVYFGQPKGGLGFKLLNKPGSMARARSGQGPGAPGTIARFTDALKWVALARKRRRLAVGAKVQGGQGELTICERYPLAEFQAMETPMDGPRLQPDQALAGVELTQYRAIPSPDLTLVLQADVDTLRRRKLDLTLEEHLDKVAAVDRLQPGPDRLVIDAGRPYDDVLLEAKTAVWKALRESR